MWRNSLILVADSTSNGSETHDSPELPVLGEALLQPVKAGFLWLGHFEAAKFGRSSCASSRGEGPEATETFFGLCQGQILVLMNEASFEFIICLNRHCNHAHCCTNLIVNFNKGGKGKKSNRLYCGMNFWFQVFIFVFIEILIIIRQLQLRVI